MCAETLSLNPTSGPVFPLTGLGSVMRIFSGRVIEACTMPQALKDRGSHYIIDSKNIMLHLQKIDPEDVDGLAPKDPGSFINKRGIDFFFSKFVLLKGNGDDYYLASLNSPQHKISPNGNVNNTANMIGRNHENISKFARKHFEDDLLDPYAGGNLYYNPHTCVLHFWGESGAYHKLANSGAHSIIRKMMSRLDIKVSFDPPFRTLKK